MKKTISKLTNKIRGGISNQKLSCYISYLMIAMLSCLFINASRYSFYCADDFSHANAVGVFGENIFELFKASIRYMIEMYRTWQGTYFSMFLQAFLSPINGFGEMQLAIVMVGNVVFFILSLLLLIKEICSFIKIDNRIKAFLSLLALFSILDFKAWPEIFYWFSGATSYSFPLSVTMLGIVLYLKNKNIITYVIACLLSFLASGGSLTVAGTSCFGILTILFVKGYKKCKKKDFIFFGIAVLGAIINTVAPGNYMRHDQMDTSGLHIGVAFLKSINQTILTLEYLLFQTPFLVILLLCIVAGFCISGKRSFNKNQIYKTMGMCAVMPIVTCFPVFLAYAPSTIYFANRCDFVCTFVVIIVIMMISVLSGILLKESGFIKEKGRELLLLSLLVLCLVMPALNESFRYSNTVIYRMCENTATGNFKRYHDEVMNIYKTIEESESADVIIESLPAAVADFQDISTTLSTDSAYWTNQALATYYGKNSIALKQPEQ